MPLSNEDFKYKIVNASNTRLVIVTYELVSDRIDKARKCLELKNFDDYKHNINSAQQFVNELVCALDMSKPIASEMADLYFFVNKLLVSALFKRDDKFLKSAAEIIDRLKGGLLKEVDDGFNIKDTSALISDIYMKYR